MPTTTSWYEFLHATYRKIADVAADDARRSIIQLLLPTRLLQSIRDNENYDTACTTIGSTHYCACKKLLFPLLRRPRHRHDDDVMDHELIYATQPATYRTNPALHLISSN